jgi:phosphate-selective porin OprO/OprP
MNTLFKPNALITAILLCSIAATASAGVVTTEGSDIIMHTDGGFGVKTADNQFSFDVVGRMNLDTSYANGVLNNAHDGKGRTDTYIRRGYFGVTGTAYKDWYFEAVMNGTGDQGDGAHFEWDTFYLKYTGFNVADITMGRAVRPFGLEQSTSSGAISTIERAAIWNLTNAGDTESSQQFELSNGNSHMSWGASIYDNGATSPSGNSRYGYDGRFTYAPIAEKTQVLHLGISLDDANIETGSLSAKSTLGAKKSDGVTFASGNFKSDRSGVLEAAYMNGPFSVQAEYLRRNLGAADTITKDATVTSYYLMGTYTLTGESRGYKAKAGKFTNITPNSPTGAWELVGRVEHVDGDQDISKTANVYLLGVNWYINKNVKAMFDIQDVTTSHVAKVGAESNGKSAAMRLQYNF